MKATKKRFLKDHPFMQDASILRLLISFECRDVWADEDRVKRLRTEALYLERMARSDREWLEGRIP